MAYRDIPASRISICDRCAFESEPQDRQDALNGWMSITTEVVGQRQTDDLCPACRREFAKFMNERLVS